GGLSLGRVERVVARNARGRHVRRFSRRAGRRDFSQPGRPAWLEVSDGGNSSAERISAGSHLAIGVAVRVVRDGARDTRACRPGSDSEPGGNTGASRPWPWHGAFVASALRLSPRRIRAGVFGSDGAE